MKKVIQRIAVAVAGLILLFCLAVVSLFLPIQTLDGQVNPVIVIVASTPSSCSTIPLKLVTGTNQLYGSNGSGGCSQIGGSGSQVYPGAGVAVSTGSAWGTSIAQSLVALLNVANTWTQGQIAPSWQLTTLTAGNSEPFFDDYYAVGTYSTAGGAIGLASGGNLCSGVNNTYLDANHPGNLVITSGTGGAGTGEYCGPNNGFASLVSVNSAVPWKWEAIVLVPSLPGTTAGSYQVGMAHTIAASPWANSNGTFYLSSTNGVANDWYCGSGSASLTFTDSTVAAVALTWVRLTIIWDGTLIHWYINSTQVCGTGTAGVTGLSMFPAGYTSVAQSASSVVLAVDSAYFYRGLTR